MAVPAGMATALYSFAPKLAPKIFESGINWGNTIGSGVSNIFDKYSEQRDNNANAQAYQKYLNYLNGVASSMKSDLEGRADKYDTKLQNLYETNAEKFDNEANTQLAELGQLVDDISQQGAEAQRQNRRQVQAELAQQGVRGGQAAILANRATGELNRDLQRDINQTVYNEAATRQGARLNNYGMQTLYPLNSMSSAYGTSLSGANNALSQAQGNVYKTAYDNAMKNYMNAQQKKKGGLGSTIGSLAGSVIGGVVGGPVGATVGSTAGGFIGKKIGG
jgi:hypothetical protein